MHAQVDAGELAGVLAMKKNADLQNQEVIIHAKAHKQTVIIQSEGRRDMMIKEAEGSAQQVCVCLCVCVCVYVSGCWGGDVGVGGWVGGGG